MRNSKIRLVKEFHDLRQVASGKNEGGPAFLFLPGGPGISGDYFIDFARGISYFSQAVYCYDYWKAGGGPRDWIHRIQLLAIRYPHLIFVGHSAGAMLLLSAQLKTFSKMILLGGALDHSWMRDFDDESYIGDRSKLLAVEANFDSHPSDASFKALCLSWAGYYFLSEFSEQGRLLLGDCAYCSEAYKKSSAYIDSFDAPIDQIWERIHFISGESDRVLPAKCLKNCIEKKKLQNVGSVNIVSGAGHFPWVEKLSSVSEIVQEIALRVK